MYFCASKFQPYLRMKKILLSLSLAIIASALSFSSFSQCRHHTTCQAIAGRQISAPFDTILSESLEGTLGDISVPSRHIVSPAKITVALPAGYSDNNSDRYPVLYLLNGHGGNNRTWSSFTNLDSLATAYRTIIVCPDGRNSWYWDSPVDSTMQMESYITSELIPFIDRHFATRADRNGRAITGLSMGGHGGLWLGLRHKDIFANCGSTSGGVDIRPFPKNWNMADRLGALKDNPKRWDEHTVINLVPTLKPGELNIIFDCGTEDFFFTVNNNLDRTLSERSIPHTYLTSPGSHNAKYWRKSIIPQLQFFHSHFYPTK